MKTKAPKISIEERYEVYKVYLNHMSVKQAKVNIRCGIAERMITRDRGYFNRRLSWEKEVFKAHLNECLTYPNLAERFGVSKRRIKDAISAARTALMNEIRKDIEAGVLIYVEIPKQVAKKKRSTTKKALESWGAHKKELFNT